VNWKEMICQSCGSHIAAKADNILDADPFAVLDREGVGAMMRLAINEGRLTRPDIKLGICGEHGGDPSSVEFCHELGLDYVSCSPFRVPIARLAAAQAALNAMPAGKKKSPKASVAASRGKTTGKAKGPARSAKGSRSARVAQGKAASRRTR
jgi:pyruvate,orthophosphate dikinase